MGDAIRSVPFHYPRQRLCASDHVELGEQLYHRKSDTSGYAKHIAHVTDTSKQGLITPPMLTSIGFGTYVFFAAFCLLALIWVYFFIPETMGRTLEQMDYVFNDNQSLAEQERRARIEAEMIGRIQAENEATKA